MAVLEINDLVVDFDTDDGLVEAIDHLTLTVREGEILGLVGESGCGKTTVARCTLGILPRPPARIRTGEIRFQGQDLLRMSESELTARIRGKAITLQLLESLPNRQQGEIRGIPGVVPSLIDPPRGCRFHTRCPFTMPMPTGTASAAGAFSRSLGALSSVPARALHAHGFFTLSRWERAGVREASWADTLPSP